MMKIMIVTAVVVTATTAASAQVLLGDPYDGVRCAQYRTAPANVFFRTPPNPLCAYGYAQLPPAVAPPPPPPSPLGRVFGPYTQAGVVSVPADGFNVRATPNGVPVAALVNGTPIIPLQREGNWLLVAPACDLTPTWLWSWTAGVQLLRCWV